MPRAQYVETIVGFAVLIIAGLFLAFSLGHNGGAAGRGDLPLVAVFNRVDGVSAGTDVKLSGVKIGSVSAIGLDPDTLEARVTLAVDKSVKIPADSIAKISTDGLLGGAYVSIEPGGAPGIGTLAANDEFEYTRGSVDLLTTLMQVFGGQSKAPSEGTSTP